MGSHLEGVEKIISVPRPRGFMGNFFLVHRTDHWSDFTRSVFHNSNIQFPSAPSAVLINDAYTTYNISSQHVQSILHFWWDKNIMKYIVCRFYISVMSLCYTRCTRKGSSPRDIVIPTKFIADVSKGIERTWGHEGKKKISDIQYQVTLAF